MTPKDPLMTLKTQADGRLDTPVAGEGGGEGGGDDGFTASPGAAAGRAPTQDSLPLLGLFAVGFGLLGIFTFAPVFVPLALVFGLIALFAGQVMLGLTAVALSLVGVVTSPSLMLILGIGAFAAWLGIPV